MREPLDPQQTRPGAEGARAVEESLDLVRALARVAREQDLAELEYRQGELRIHLVFEPPVPQAVAPVPPGGGQAPPAPAPPRPAAAAARPADSVVSPLAGVFYRAPRPGAPPFVEEGQEVAAGQCLCIVEAMKLMNEIHAEAPCRIIKILVANGEAVEKGQALFQIEKL